MKISKRQIKRMKACAYQINNKKFSLQKNNLVDIKDPLYYYERYLMSMESLYKNDKHGMQALGDRYMLLPEGTSITSSGFDHIMLSHTYVRQYYCGISYGNRDNAIDDSAIQAAYAKSIYPLCTNWMFLDMAELDQQIKTAYSARKAGVYGIQGHL